MIKKNDFLNKKLNTFEKKLQSLHGNAFVTAHTYIKSTSVVYFILPPSIHFEISFLVDAYNF